MKSSAGKLWIVVAVTFVTVLFVVRYCIVPAPQPPWYKEHGSSRLDRLLLHRLNGPRRGKRLVPGEASRPFTFRFFKRNWRQFYLPTPDSGNDGLTCTCQLQCNDERTRGNVDLYMTDWEPYIMHTDAAWDEEYVYACISRDNDSTSNESCSIQSYRAEWYCYAVVHNPSGFAKRCTLTCDYVE